MAVSLMCGPASALIVYDAPGSLDNSRNVIDPQNAVTYPSGPTASGVPWQHVARYGMDNASAVYIGNGFLLTARHVGISDADILIQGTAYLRDTTYTTVPITIPGPSGNTVVDLRVDKILGDPGLPVLPILGTGTQDTNLDSVMVGWGVGKGSLAGSGWTWGGDATRALRWGTNRTLTSAIPITYTLGPTFSYSSLATTFDFPPGGNEAAGTLGDSGSGLLQKVGGVWRLAGITTTVTQGNVSATDDATFFVRLQEYSWVLRYSAWKARYGISASAEDSSDADGDGVPLLTEYALGLDPTVSSVDGLPVAAVEGSQLALTFRRLASVTDVRITVETCTDLVAGNWSTVTPVITVLDGTTVFQTVKATVPFAGIAPLFARLRVTRL